MQRFKFVVALVIAALVVSPGCGGGRGNTIRVTGQLLKGGAKYVPPRGQLLSVTFVGLEIEDASGKKLPSGEPFLATLDQESATFSVPGPEGYGIPPGKYRVAVTQRMARDAFEEAKKAGRTKKGATRETDLLSGRYSVETSPIVLEVKTSGEVTVDLDNPTG